MRHEPNTFERTATAFARDRRGNFAIMTAAVSAVLMLAVGYGINTAQLFQVKSSLRNALDAAVTSTARDLTTGKISENDAADMVGAFLQANGNFGLAAGKNVVLDSVVVDKTAKTVTADAHADVDLLFPFFGPLNNTRIALETAALYSDKHIEVAMMLDITGSMGGQKIKDLRDAADVALDAFLGGQDPKNQRVRVAIVPYADAVNTGDLSNVVYVETRHTAGEPPKLDDPMPASSAPAPDKCATERKGAQQYTDASPYVAMVNRDYFLDYCPPVALKPLSSDIDALKKTVSKFYANGSTAGHIGIQWSWYMLSEKWADVLPKSARPEPKDPKKVAKFAILMTDGEFNTAFDGVGRKSRVHSQETQSSAAAEKLCAAMKADGIEIFTVGFMLDQAGAKAVMKDCASADKGNAKHFFDTSSGAELKDAFLTIARNVENLALTK
jgi:Flp pilus assembly protein TadG